MGLVNVKYQSPNYRTLNINNPCKGGLNIHDLDFKIDEDQSPEVLNMIYRNGVFGKRYGQQLVREYENEIKNIIPYKDSLIVHSGSNIYRDSDVIKENVGEEKGKFFKFNRNLYYLCPMGYYQYDGTEFKEVEYYVPDVIINRSPNGTTSVGDTTDDKINALSSAFNTRFNGDGTSKDYFLYDFKEQKYDATQPKVFVDTTSGEVEIQVTAWDKDTRKVTLATAPAQGTNNVKITAYITDEEVRNRILKSKYACAYGGENNSRLFLGGNGDSLIYYSDVFDASYFPETNYFTIGNSEEDVTGFGEQYDVLMVFKPKEIYSLDYYTDNEGIGQFSVKLVNSEIGCDAPNTIQIINNQLTWFHSRYSVCTLVSTNIEDERNVRRVGRNIEGDSRVNGILEEPNLKECVGFEWDNKYYLCFESGIAYVWDYYLSPYFNSGKLEEDAKRFAWFKYNNFYVKGFVASDKPYWFNGNKIATTSTRFSDFGNAIHSIYKTPLFEFNATDFLKTIKNIFIQSRGDAFARTSVSYNTIDEQYSESEPIIVNPKAMLWGNFKWSEFAYSVTTSNKVTRIKASIKKVQALQLIFENNEINNDMSITNLGLDYYVVREVK